MLVHLLLAFSLAGIASAIVLMVVRMRRSEAVLATGMRSMERVAWVFLVAGLVGSTAMASVLYVGPLILTDANGSTQITVGSGSASAAAGANSYLTFARGGLVFTDTNTTTTTWGTNTAPAVASTSISATFAANEPDTGYQILLTTTGTTAANGNGAGFVVGDKYVGSFEIRNPSKHIGPIGVTWLKFRTSTP